MVTQYNVSTLREQDRFAYWHDLICRLFPRAAGRRGDDLPFVAHLDRSVLGAVEVSDISCNALRYDRARQDQRQDDNEDFLLSLMLQGNAQLEQDGRIAVQGPGDIVLYDAARPFIYDFPEAYRILLAKTPRMNVDFALERPDVAAEVLPGIGLVEDTGRSPRRRSDQLPTAHPAISTRSGP